MPQVLIPVRLDQATSPLVYIPQPQNSCSAIYSDYKSKKTRIFSILQITFGILAILAEIAVGVFSYNGYGRTSRVFAGGWAGILCIVTGSFGIATSNYRTRYLVITHLCLAISTSVAGGTGMLVELIYCLMRADYWFMGGCFQDRSGYDDDEYFHYNPNRYCKEFAAFCMVIILIACFVVETTTLIWVAVLDGKVLCFGSPAYQGVQEMQPMMLSDQQIVYEARDVEPAATAACANVLETENKVTLDGSDATPPAYTPTPQQA